MWGKHLIWQLEITEKFCYYPPPPPNQASASGEYGTILLQPPPPLNRVGPWRSRENSATTPPPTESCRLLEITEKTQEIQQAQLGSSVLRNCITSPVVDNPSRPSCRHNPPILSSTFRFSFRVVPCPILFYNHFTICLRIVLIAKNIDRPRIMLPAVAIHRPGVVDIGPSPHHCFRTAHPCAQSVGLWSTWIGELSHSEIA